MKVRELLTTWGFNVDMQALDRMDNKIGELRKNAKNFGANMKSVTDGMVSQGLKLTAFVSAPIIGIGVAMTKAASDAEETLAKFDTVFQDVGTQATATADNLSKNFGLSSRAAKQLLGDTGDLLTGFGFTGDMALDLSKNVNELAVDLASFTNFSGGAEGASAALTKALLGERESVKALGISILDEDVKAKVASLRASGKLRGETERQQKAYATLQIALDQSKNAQGDFARTQDSLANQTRIFRARVDDLAVTFGQILIPYAKKLVVGLTKLAEKFNGLSADTKQWILIAFGTIAVLAPLLLIAGLVGSAILALGSAFTLLKSIMLAVRAASLATILTWAAIPILIGLVIAAAGLLLDDLWSLATGGQSAIGALINTFIGGGFDIKTSIAGIVAGFQSFIDWVNVASSVAVVAFDVIVNSISLLLADLWSLATGGQSAIGDLLASFGFAGELVTAIFIGIVANIQSMIAWVTKAGQMVGEILGGAFTKVGELASGALKTVTDFFSFGDKGQAAKKEIAGAGQAVNDFFGVKPKPVQLVQPLPGEVTAPGAANTIAANATGATIPTPAIVPAPPILTPLENIAAAATLPIPRPAPATRTNMTKINNVDVRPTINIEVPAGTPEEQQRVLSESAKIASEEVFNREVRNMINENPEVA